MFSSRQNQNGNGPADQSTESLSPPDEHTRLLPNRLDSDVPFLSPDDPAVSPYNLWTVRAVRYITIFFTIVTFLWWVLQLVSIFVTPPGMHTRGSNFFSFAYANLALITLVITLLFFAAPSQSARIMAAITSALLLVDMIIILSVQRTRHEENWLGIVSVVWALLMSIWTIVADRTVQWGKAEEEQRLTGRAESRRSFLEWTEVTLSTLLMLILTLITVLLTCSLIIRAVDAALLYPGRKVWVDGQKYQVHVFCEGSKSRFRSPTVLIEGGEDTVENGLWQFAQNAVKNGSITRYCFADRPGMAWSDAAPSPLSVGGATDALSEALAAVGETGPWILVSAGVGSVYSRVFSSRHGRDVHGMLMIDPLHEDLLHRVGDPGRGFWIWVRGVLSPLGWDRIPGAILRGRSREDRVWGISSYQSGKTIQAKLQENLVADSLSKRDVVAARAIQYQDTPLAIISSGDQIRKDAEWEAKQRDLGRLTHNLTHWDIVDKAPHLVWRTYEGRERIEKRLKQLVRMGEISGAAWDQRE